MDGQQPTRRLDAAGQRALGTDQDHVGGLAPVAGEQLVPAADAVDAIDRRHGPHHPGQAIAGTPAFVANQHAGHVIPPADGVVG